MANPSRRPTLLANALLALGSTAVALAALAAAEACARRDHSGDGATDHARLHRYSERYGWEPRPGATVCGGGRCVSVNRAGHRGRAAAGPPAPGTLRVVLLGDSVAFGYDVDDGETFAARLDAGDPALEVLNLAVQGYGTGQQLLLLRDELPRLRPDVVLVSVCLANDLVDNGLERFLYDGRYPKPYFRVLDGELVLHDDHLRLSSMGRLARYLEERSHLYALVSRRLAEWRAEADGDPLDPDHWLDTVEASLGDLNAAVELTARLLGAIGREAAARDARTVIVLHPAGRSFHRGNRIVRKLLRSPHLAGLEVVDMKRRYEERGLALEDLLLDEIGHLSAEGHRVTAEILAEALAALTESPGTAPALASPPAGGEGKG